MSTALISCMFLTPILSLSVTAETAEATTKQEETQYADPDAFLADLADAIQIRYDYLEENAEADDQDILMIEAFQEESESLSDYSEQHFEDPAFERLSSAYFQGLDLITGSESLKDDNEKAYNAMIEAGQLTYLSALYGLYTSYDLELNDSVIAEFDDVIDFSNASGTSEEGVFSFEDYDIEIKYWNIIRQGDGGNVSGKSDVLAIWYDTTNKSGIDINCEDAWNNVMTAAQDSNPNSVNMLTMADLPDSDFANTYQAAIEKNRTASNAVAYYLTDNETNVVISAEYEGSKVGEYEINIAEGYSNLDVFTSEEFNPTTANSFYMGGMKFRIPQYFDACSCIEGGTYFYPEVEYTSAAFMFIDANYLLPPEFTKEQLVQISDKFVSDLFEKGFRESMGADFDAVERTEKEGFTLWTATGTADYGNDATIRMAVILRKSGELVITYVLIDSDDHSHHDYYGDFDKMLSNIEIIEDAPNNVSPDEQKDDSSTIGSTVEDGVVRPEIKDFLDSYEALMDEYVEFMEKASKADQTDLSFLMEYADYMSRLAEFAEKADEIENMEMNDAETNYYLEVMLRINQKLLSAAES